MRKTIVFETDDYRWAVMLMGAAAQVDPSIKLGIKFKSNNPAVLRMNDLCPGEEDFLVIPLPEIEDDYLRWEQQEFERIRADRWQLEGVIMEGEPPKLSLPHMAQAIMRSIVPGKYMSIRPRSWTPTKAEVEGNDFDCVVDCAESIPYALAFLQGLGLTSPTIETCDGCTDEQVVTKVLSPHVKLVVGPATWVGTYAAYSTYKGFDQLHKSPAMLLVYGPQTAWSREAVVWASCNAASPDMPAEVPYMAGCEWRVRTKYKHDDITYLKDVAKSKQASEGVSDLPQPSRGSNSRSRRGKKGRR